MPRNEWYRQCGLRRPAGKYPIPEYDRDGSVQVVRRLDNSEAFEEMVSWIPADIAVVGNTVRLKAFSRDKEWSEGWEIISVGPKRSGEVREAYADLWKRQREVSDI